MTFLQEVFWVVVLLGIMIMVHELGHFWAAVAVGVKVETFSLGFGPRLFGWKRGETDFRISAIPFGGYVRMFGEQPGQLAAAIQGGEDESAAAEASSPPADPRAFFAKPRWQRAIVILAGPLMNVILAITIVTGLYMYAFPKEIEATDPAIASIAPDSPAARAGLQPGDKIISIADKTHPTWQDVLTTESLNANHAVPVIIDRHGRRLSFTVVPRMDPKQGVGIAGWDGEGDVQVEQVAKGSPAASAGLQPGDLLLSVNNQPIVSLSTVQEYLLHSQGKPVELKLMRKEQAQNVSVTPARGNDRKLPWKIGVLLGYRVQRVKFVKLGIGPALVESLRFNKQNANLIFRVLGSIVERRVSPKALAGPIGMAKMSQEAAQQGLPTFLGFMAVVSLNLAIFNLLPIPILDGGTLLLLIIEMLLQREVSLQVKETILKLGFVFLMMIVVFVIYNDISRIVTNG